MPNLYPNRAARRAAQRSNRRRKLVGVVSVLGVGAASGVIAAPPAGAASYTVTNLEDRGAGSLAQAIADANGSPGPDTILFASDLSGTLYSLETLTITDAVTITGPGAASVTIDGGGANDRILDITAEATAVSISGLRFYRGEAGETGSLDTDNGGAIRSVGADLTLTGTVFADNSALENGGAISVSQADLSITGSTFTGNSITGGFLQGGDAGGAVQLSGGNLTVAGSAFTGNRASRQGGAISASNTTGLSTITDSTFSGNLVSVNDGIGFSAAGGGAILTGEAFTISGSSFTGNTLSGDDTNAGGGGVLISTRTNGIVDDQEIVTYGDVKILDSTFSGNSAAAGGGALVSAGDLEVDGSTFEGNRATAGGGGLKVLRLQDGSIAQVAVSDSEFTDNTLPISGGVYLGSGGAINAEEADLGITGSRFSGNTSGLGAGAVYVTGSSLTVGTSTFEGNTASGDGGAIQASVEDLAIADTTISGNTALRGGGIYAYSYADPQLPDDGPTLTLSNVTLDGNQAIDGAAIFAYTYAYLPGSEGTTATLDHLTITGSPATNNPVHLEAAGEASPTLDITISNTAIDVARDALVLPGDAAVTYSRFGSDLMLGELADNGGPTLTRLPLTGSPLINTGDPAYADLSGAAAFDQRGEGFPRVSAGRTDIGAVEVQAQAGVPVVTVATAPTSTSVVAGQPATFSASCTATESAAVSYQWQGAASGSENFADIPGATGATYTIDATTIEQNGDHYRVVCSAPGATPVTSNAAELTVTAPVVTVTTQPSSQSVTAGQTVTFTAACASTGTGPVGYKWQASLGDGDPFRDIGDATSSSFTITTAQVPLSDYRFRVRCTADGAISVYSDPVTATVTAPVITVGTAPSNQSVAAGQTATFTASCATNGNGPVTYQWQASTGGAPFANIPGATSSSYTTAATVAGQSGSQYRVVCSAPNAAPATSGSATLTVTAPASAYSVTILTPTAGSTVQAGALVPVQFRLAGPNGQKLTPLQGLVLTLTCSARVSVAGQAPTCAIYNPLTGNFITLIKAPTNLANGAALPITATVVNNGAAIATATTTVTVRR